MLVNDAFIFLIFHWKASRGTYVLYVILKYIYEKKKIYISFVNSERMQFILELP